MLKLLKYCFMHVYIFFINLKIIYIFLIQEIIAIILLLLGFSDHYVYLFVGAADMFLAWMRYLVWIIYEFQSLEITLKEEAFLPDEFLLSRKCLSSGIILNFLAFFYSGIYG